ncbi:MAG: hypothetical protein AAFO74_03505 [Pseudomonadota bacterium]
MQSDESKNEETWTDEMAQETLVQDWLTVLEAAPIEVANLPPKLADELAHAHAALRRVLNK